MTGACFSVNLMEQALRRDEPHHAGAVGPLLVSLEQATGKGLFDQGNILRRVVRRRATTPILSLLAGEGTEGVSLWHGERPEPPLGVRVDRNDVSW